MSALRRAIVGRARERRARLAWLAQAAADEAPARRIDGDAGTGAFHAKLSPDHPDYSDRVAKPVMEAVDGLPEAYRACVHEFGYVDVYRAWKRGISPARIRQMAEANGGRFVL